MKINAENDALFRTWIIKNISPEQIQSILDLTRANPIYRRKIEWTSPNERGSALMNYLSHYLIYNPDNMEKFYDILRMSPSLGNLITLLIIFLDSDLS